MYMSLPQPSGKMIALSKTTTSAASGSGSNAGGRIYSFHELKQMAFQATMTRSHWGVTKVAYGTVRFIIEDFYDVPGMEHQQENRFYFGCIEPKDRADSASGAAKFLEQMAQTAVNASPNKRRALNDGAVAARLEVTSTVPRLCGAKVQQHAKPIVRSASPVVPAAAAAAAASSSAITSTGVPTASGAPVAAPTTEHADGVYQATFTGFTAIANSREDLLAADKEDPENWWICKHDHVQEEMMPMMHTHLVITDHSESAVQQQKAQNTLGSGSGAATAASGTSASSSGRRSNVYSNARVTPGTVNLGDAANPFRIRAALFEEGAGLVFSKDHPGKEFYEQFDASPDVTTKTVDAAWIEAVRTKVITMRAKLTITFKDNIGSSLIEPTSIEMLLMSDVRKP
jgi:hypothetical protein